MRHHFTPGHIPLVSPLNPDDQRPPPLPGAPTSAPGVPVTRPGLPENATRIEQLIYNLGSEDWTVCTEAQSELTRMGTNPVDALCDVLRTGAWNVRWRAAWVLGRIADISAVPPLCDALKDKYGYAWEANLQSFGSVDRAEGRPLVPTATQEQRALLRMEAAEALGRIAEPEAIPALCGALADGFEQVRERASLALAQIGPEAFAAVTEVVEGSGTEARVWAVRALTRMNDPAAIPILVWALEDRSAGVRVAAAEGLAELAGAYPVLELRGALPILRRNLSPWSLSGADRAAFTAALTEIEARTAALHDLPLPTVSGAAAAEMLPLPAQPHASGTDQLPLPAHTATRPAFENEKRPGFVRRVRSWLRERLR